MIWNARQARKGETESVFHFVVTEGFYYVRVDGRAQDPTDKYTLSIRALGSWREHTETEPNDDPRIASELRLDVPMTGRISKDVDVDSYV